MDHEWRIDEREYARHEARRGRRHAFEDLTPGRTALVVVDMVPFFCDENPYAQGIAPRINKLADHLRGVGGLTVWAVPAPVPVTDVHVEFYGAEIADRYARSGGDVAPRRRMWSGMEVSPADVVVEKTQRSALFPGSSRLERILTSRGIDTVLVAGTVASVCCESTVRDAAALGFRPVMVADGVADVSDDVVNATLRTVYRSFGDVRPVDDLLACVRPPGRA